MKYAYFEASCPLEIGDKVIDAGGIEKIITDIMCCHFIKSGDVTFHYELDNNGIYCGIDVKQHKWRVIP